MKWRGGVGSCHSILIVHARFSPCCLRAYSPRLMRALAFEIANQRTIAEVTERLPPLPDVRGSLRRTVDGPLTTGNFGVSDGCLPAAGVSRGE